MIPAAFDYLRPESLEEAVALLQHHGSEALLLAGGHSLLPQMKLRQLSPLVLIDLERIPSLRGIREVDGKLWIGAMTTHAELEHSVLIQNKLPLISQAAGVVSDPLIRNRGTIGGALVQADSGGDWPAVALVLEAELVFFGPDGERSVAAHSFLSARSDHPLRPSEILTGIRIPLLSSTARAAYLKRMHPASGYALVGVAAVLDLAPDKRCLTCRIGITGAGEVAVRGYATEAVMVAETWTLERVAAASRLATSGLRAVGDRYGSVEYRIHLASVYVRRNLESLAASLE